MDNLGKKIALLLRENNMTQKELAEKIDSTEMSISRYIRNIRQPKADILSKIASALNTTTDDLLDRNIPTDENDEFNSIHRLLARKASKMSTEKKQQLIKTILSED
jgi:transcriptional regulator with XRE-family HTH domain